MARKTTLFFSGKAKDTKSLEIFSTGQKIDADPDGSVLEALIEAGVEISHTCGGMGTCGTCRVIMHSACEQERTDLEKEIAEDRGFSENERLCCQLEIEENLVIEIPT